MQPTALASVIAILVKLSSLAPLIAKIELEKPSLHLVLKKEPSLLRGVSMWGGFPTNHTPFPTQTETSPPALTTLKIQLRTTHTQLSNPKPSYPIIPNSPTQLTARKFSPAQQVHMAVAEKD